MDQKKINRYIERLADNISLKMNSAQFSGRSGKIIIVEGNTDEKFMRKIINEGVGCISAKEAFSNEDFFRMTEDEEKDTTKTVIIGVVYGLAVYPALLNTKGLEKSSVYGLIDMDFDEESEQVKTNKLFITDTHDLETLLLSTDENIWQRIEKCKISNTDIEKAYFVSYQLGIIKKAIICNQKDKDFLKPLEPGKNDVEYSEFITECKVNIPDLILYLNKKCKNKLSQPKTKQLISKILQNRDIKKKTDAMGTWKQSVEEFSFSATSDFWNVVNGHHILALLRFYNDEAKIAYAKSRGYSMNREFEMEIINNYDYECIKGTDLYMKMKQETVAK